ncbi:MAG: AraC family transcriptional regulator ligand-binding domain-containing protein [Arenicella sp.]|nr:AraC family transcriptional regulator ligand-binding domain-containing protein [Arenicella sp.]
MPLLSFLLHYLNSQGLSEEHLGSAMGFPKTWAAKITLQELTQVLPKIFREAQGFTRDEFLGLHAGEQFHFCLAGLGGLVATHAPTPWQALADVAELVPSFGVLTIEQKSVGSYTKISATCPTFWSPSNCTQLLDIFFSATLSALRHLSGPKLMPRSLHLSRPAPKSAEAYIRIFGDVSSFGQEKSAILFKTSDLECDSLLYEAHLYEQLRFSAVIALGSGESDFELLQSIRKGIRGGAFSLAEIASKLDRSTRSVQRGLQREGTNFRSLLSETRADLAVEMLRDTELPINILATRLNYSNGKALSRAVKKATGLPPRALRRNGLDDD